ncbi:response regulator [Crateriforma spongiae]|uniref:response regulator n=1 Tax=Crateriforma spongiae TaxID=2724528 RepID=UPI001446F638|nr:response regulator [Crateriforma spongiae]
MLVLSRRENENVLFPSLGITVKVLRVRGKVVSVGLDAPANVPIVRSELADDQDYVAAIEARSQTLDAEHRHAIKNLLNGATIGLSLLRRQIQLERYDEIEETLGRLMNSFTNLESVLRPEEPAEREEAILLIEDDANERELLAGLLRHYGFAVTTANDGDQALHAIEDGLKPDFVLLDMNLPHCDGPTFLQRIKAQGKTLPVFAVSGSSPSEMGLEDGGETGIREWFSKPLNPDRLVRELQSAAAGGTAA